MVARRVLYALLEPTRRPLLAPYILPRTSHLTPAPRHLVSIADVRRDEEAELEQRAPERTTTTVKAVPADSEDVPWYLRSGESLRSAQTLQAREPLPAFPDNCPPSLQTLSEYMIKDLGLTDLTVVDLRHIRPATSFGPDAIMILCNGKSSRHLSRASHGLVTYLKMSLNTLAEAEGVLTSNFLRVYNRRLRKKAQRQGTANRGYTSNDDLVDRTGSWVIVDTKMDGVFVHLFLPEKRTEVDLETHWTDLATNSRKNVIPTELLPKTKFDKRFVLPGSRRTLYTAAAADSKFASSAVVEPEVAELSETEEYLNELEQWSRLGDYKRCIRLTSFGPDNVSSRERTKATDLVLKSHINNLSLRQQQLADPLAFPQNPLSYPSRPTCELKRSSDVVVSFVNVCPTDPTAMQWRLRLIFLHKAHLLNSAEFPLELLLEHASIQQASGIPLEKWDVEMIVSAIAYSKQFTEGEQFAKETWRRACDEKFALVMQVHDIAFRSTGEKFLVSDTLLALLYRLCYQSTSEAELTPGASSSSASPSPQESPRAFLDPRATPLSSLFGDQANGGLQMTKPLVLLVISVLINSSNWPKFWALWNNINAYTIVDSDLLAAMVSLVAKSGDERNITYMIERYLPQFLLDTESAALLTPECITAVRQCVEFLDPHQKSYQALRQYIEAVH